MAADLTELRAIYGHVLRAMQRYEVAAFVHYQPEPIPPALQYWLLGE